MFNSMLKALKYIFTEMTFSEESLMKP